MNRLRIKAALVLLMAMSAVFAAQAWRPHQRLVDSRPKVQLDQMFPSAFADWRLDDRQPMRLVSPDTQAMLDKIYNQTLNRTYVNGNGDHIMLSVAYGGDQSDATRAHRPEVCYPAQGFEILQSDIRVLDLGGRGLRVRELLSRQGARVEPITYWITVGERVAITGAEQKLAQLSYSTRGVVPDGMLVRVSSIGDDTGRAYTLHQQFLTALSRAIPGPLQSQVVGRSPA